MTIGQADATLTATDDESTTEAVEEKQDRRAYPYELSDLIKSFYERRNARRVFAINSRDGSILSAFDPAYRFGVQLEEQRACDNGAHTRAQGPTELVARLLANLNAKVEHAIVDLTGQEEATPLLQQLDVLRDGLEREAEEASGSTYAYNNILTTFIVDADREDWVLKHPAFGPRSFQVVRVEELGISVVFTATSIHHVKAPHVRTVDIETLDLLAPKVDEQLKERTVAIWYTAQSAADPNELKKAYQAVHREVGRRTLGQDLAPHERWDVSVIGKTLNVLPSDYAKLMIQQQGKQRIVASHGKNVTWLAKNLAAWEQMLDLERLSSLEIDPETRPIIEAAVAQAIQIRTPNYQLPPAMRLGYLIGRSAILCTKTTEGFERGRLYPLRYSTDVTDKRTYEGPEPDKYGVEVEVFHERTLKALSLTIGHRTFQDTRPEDIAFIIEHFEVPDPGDQATLFPDLVASNLAIIDDIEARLITPNLKRLGSKRTQLFNYQKGDLARVMCKPSMLTAWEPGLGKSCAGAVLIEAYQALGAEKRALIVAPSDLIPQWRRELKKFTGREATVLPRKQRGNESGEQYQMHILAEMRDLGRRMARGEADGIYLISYESLSLKGQALVEKDDVHIHGVKKITTSRPRPPRRRPDGTWDHGSDRYQVFDYQWSAKTCPQCGSEIITKGKCNAVLGPRGKWTAYGHGSGRKLKGQRCGWRDRTQVPTIAKLLSPGLKDGIVIVDEGTRIANLDSQRTQAVMKLKARHRHILTGTPIKNYVGQAFPLLLWCFGPKSPMFEYGWGAQTEWIDKFAVKERYHDPNDKRNWKYRVTGQITNLSELYVTLAVCSIRLTKADTGEKVVPLKTHVLEAPRGVKQTEQIVQWADTFSDWFRSKYPDHPLCQLGNNRTMSAFLGLHKKWEYACSIPTADPDRDWTGVEVSDFTPMMLQTLTTTLKLVRHGRRVIVGTYHRAAGEFIADQLGGKGVVVDNLVGSTPAQRAAAIERFQSGKSDVIVSTIKALSHGHNIDKANAVVCHGLEWAYDVHFQFLDRAHRITSEKPVDVFITLPGTEAQSVFGRIFRSLQEKQKGNAAALDGIVEDLEYARLSASEVTKALLDQGVEPDGTEVHEDKVKRAWLETPVLANLPKDDDFEGSLCSWDDHDEDAPLRRRAYVTPMFTHGDVATALEKLHNNLRAVKINGAVTIGDAIDQAVERKDALTKAWIATPGLRGEIERPSLSLGLLAEAVAHAAALKPVAEFEPLDDEMAEMFPPDGPEDPMEPCNPEEKDDLEVPELDDETLGVDTELEEAADEATASVEPPETEEVEQPTDVIVPTDDLTAALLKQMEEFKAEMEALKAKNEELEQRLGSSEQMSLFGGAE